MVMVIVVLSAYFYDNSFFLFLLDAYNIAIALQQQWKTNQTNSKIQFFSNWVLMHTNILEHV